MKRTALVLLITAIGGLGLGSVSTNVPLNHWSYAAIDKLVGEGLIDSAMPGTKPFSRLEMARLISEAGRKAERQGEENRIILALLDRLQKEFKFEVDLVGSSRVGRSEDYIKPVEDPYLRFVYGREPFDLENQSGERFDKGGNSRLGFATRMNVFDSLAFYVHPEYETASADTRVEAIEAYGKAAIGKLDIEVGKDSLWWGPGYHASMLMSNNAAPFTMLKVSNPEPIQLPWLLHRLGPFKAVYFLARLEDNRDHPGARLTGLRLSIKPCPSLELGASRTTMFGGRGVPDIGLKDYLRVFWPAANLHGYSNQLASLDAAWLMSLPGSVPARSAKCYIDYTGEDADGFEKWRPLLGLQVNDLFRTGRTDLRMEYANDHVGGFPDVFYNHGLYTSGYTYKGRVIGDFMGTDAEDLFLRLTHYLTPDLVLGLDFDRLRTNLSGSPRPVTHRYGADLFWFAPRNWELRTAYRYEQTGVDSVSNNNHVLDFSLVYHF